MWIPYDIRGSLKAGSDAGTLASSRVDGARRDFIIGFFVRNPVTQAWELDVIASPGGEEFVVDDGAGGSLALRLCGNEAGKLSEVVIRLAASSADSALARAHDALQRRLLRYIVETGRGMAIAGWRVADPAHGAVWHCTPFRPSVLQLDHAALAPLPADLQPVVELFQRARNATDATSRLLAAHAILAAALRGLTSLENAGAGDFRLTREMLVHAGAMALDAELTGRSLGTLLARLQPEINRLVGPGGLLAAAGDGFARQRELARLANLADLVAHRLLRRVLAAREARGGRRDEPGRGAGAPDRRPAWGGAASMAPAAWS